MQVDKLPLDAIVKKVREAKKQKVAEIKRAQAVKAIGRSKPGSSQRIESGSTQTGFAGSSSQSEITPSQSVEDIIQGSKRFNPRQMGEVVEKFGAGEDVLARMPMAEIPERLTTKLLPYQRQALAWLLEKENPQLPPAGSTEIVQLWKRSAQDPRLFTNIATNFSIKDEKPVLASGGILADDMGLGKTLEMIALMVADPVLSESQSKTTLIVAPLGVMSNWTGQVRCL